MKCRRISTLEEFEALAPLWAVVAREGGQASPFLSHDWFGCCWRAAGPSRHPEALVIEDAMGPVGLVPLVRWEGRFRKVPVRFLGVLNAPDTPFVDWLVVGPPESVIEAVMAELADWPDWDVLTLRGVPATSPTLKTLETWLPGRFRWQHGAPIRSPHVVISDLWETFWAAKSQRFKKTVRSVRNRLTKAGAVTIEEHRSAPAGSTVFEELLEVSRRSWKAEHGLAIATMPRMPQFFRELTDLASANGWLRLWVLRLDGRAVATEYQIESDGCVHALRADFDSTLPMDLSPGAHLSCEILRALFAREGVHEYDMGPGDNDYKSRLASDAHETAHLLVFRPGAYGAALHALETRAVPLWRRLRGDGGKS